MDTFKKGRQKGFDCFKAIACAAVVLIHFNFRGEVGDIAKTACRFAVPFFFVVSGYFLSNPDRQIRKLIRLLLISTVAFGLFSYWCEMVKSHGAWMPWIDFSRKYLSAAQLVKFFITNNGLFSAPLWFVGALIYCNLFVLVFFHNEYLIRFARWLAIPLLIGLFAMEEFSKVLGISWQWLEIRGTSERAAWSIYFFFLFRAFPFFMIGNWLRTHKGTIEAWKINNWLFCAFALIGCAVSVFEYYLLGNRIVQFYIGSVLTTVALAIWAIRMPNAGVSWLAWIGSELSMLIYIIHPGVGKLMVIMADIYHWWGTPWFHPCKFIIVFATSAISSLMILFLMKTWGVVTLIAKGRRQNGFAQ